MVFFLSPLTVDSFQDSLLFPLPFWLYMIFLDNITPDLHCHVSWWFPDLICSPHLTPEGTSTFSLTSFPWVLTSTLTPHAHHRPTMLPLNLVLFWSLPWWWHPLLLCCLYQKSGNHVSFLLNPQAHWIVHNILLFISPNFFPILSHFIHSHCLVKALASYMDYFSNLSPVFSSFRLSFSSAFPHYCYT